MAEVAGVNMFYTLAPLKFAAIDGSLLANAAPRRQCSGSKGARSWSRELSEAFPGPSAVEPASVTQR